MEDSGFSDIFGFSEPNDKYSNLLNINKLDPGGKIILSSDSASFKLIALTSSPSINANGLYAFKLRTAPSFKTSFMLNGVFVLFQNFSKLHQRLWIYLNHAFQQNLSEVPHLL